MLIVQYTGDVVSATTVSPYAPSPTSSPDKAPVVTLRPTPESRRAQAPMMPSTGATTIAAVPHSTHIDVDVA